MALFESYERRIDQINAALNKYGIKDIDEAKAICDAKGLDPYKMCEETQKICFENAKWAYVVGAAIAIKKGVKTAADAAAKLTFAFANATVPKVTVVMGDAPTEFTIEGTDKCLVGQFADKVHKVRKADPYKGKGIFYKGERIRRKEGKKK